MFRIASQGLFCYNLGVNTTYREHLKKLEGDAVAVLIRNISIPLDGIIAILDWRLNATISHLVIGKKYKARPGETLLLNTELAIGIPKTFIIGVGKGYNNELSKAIIGLRIKNLCIVLSETIKKDHDLFIKELQTANIRWGSINVESIGDEQAIILKDIEH